MRPTPSLAILLLLALIGCGRSSPNESATIGATILDNPTRPAEERGRDAGTLPLYFLGFTGTEPGDTVADLHAGEGYFTYILSKFLGPGGLVYAESHFREERLQERIEQGDLKDSKNVRFAAGYGELPTDCCDAVIMVRAYHDVSDIDAFFAEVHRFLKPRGLVGVIDVRTPLERDQEAHRIGEETLIREWTAHGFRLDGRSEVLARPDDDPSKPLWEARHETDRMMLRFVVEGDASAG